MIYGDGRRKYIEKALKILQTRGELRLFFDEVRKMNRSERVIQRFQRRVGKDK